MDESGPLCAVLVENRKWNAIIYWIKPVVLKPFRLKEPFIRFKAPFRPYQLLTFTVFGHTYTRC